MARTAVNRLLTVLVLLLWSASVQAATVRIAFPDGKPASDARLTITIDGKYEFPVVSDEDGEFIFPCNDFKTAVIELSSSNGSRYLPITIPSEIAIAGNLSLVIEALR